MDISVVGVGPGNKEWITCKGLQVIQEATLLIGAKRHVELFEDLPVNKIVNMGRIEALIKLIEEHSEEKIVILASGDPLLFGIGNLVKDHYPQVEIISGISSLQYIFTKIPESMNDTFFTSVHGRTLNLEVLKNYSKVALVTDKETHPGVLANYYKGLKSRFYIGSNLGYADEKIYAGSAEDFLDFNEIGLHVVVICNER